MPSNLIGFLLPFVPRQWIQGQERSRYSHDSLGTTHSPVDRPAIEWFGSKASGSSFSAFRALSSRSLTHTFTLHTQLLVDCVSPRLKGLQIADLGVEKRSPELPASWVCGLDRPREQSRAKAGCRSCPAKVSRSTVSSSRGRDRQVLASGWRELTGSTDNILVTPPDPSARIVSVFWESGGGLPVCWPRVGDLTWTRPRVSRPHKHFAVFQTNSVASSASLSAGNSSCNSSDGCS